MTEPQVTEAEVKEKATRRRFTAEYKKRILDEADGCRRPGEIGALLRREGLFSSTLTDWRNARRRGELEEKRRGPRPQEKNPLEDVVQKQEREMARLRARLERAEAIIDLQKKVSFLLGIQLPEEKS